MSSRMLIAATLALAFGVAETATAPSALAEPTAGAPLASRTELVGSLQSRVDALAQQIHLRYRHHQPSLSERREAAEKVLADWNDVASQVTGIAAVRNHDLMTAWLGAALRAVMPGGSGNIPAAPAFERTAPLDPGAEIALPAVTDEVVPTLDPQQPGPSGRVQVRDSATTIENPYVTSTPEPTVTPDATVTVDSSPTGSRNPLRSRPAPTVERPKSSQFVGPRATQRSSAKPVLPADSPAPQDAADESSAARESRSKWSRHPSAAPLEWRDPFSDDPSVSPNPLRSGASRRALRPDYREAPSSRVDLRRLAAEVRGYNAAVQALQAAVMALGEGDAAALGAANSELDRLDERRQFIELYRDGLTASERMAIPDSASPELVRELVKRKAESLSSQSPQSRAEGRRTEHPMPSRVAGNGF
ncbi:hypothetical protein [Botrimarina colliarenosi]|nr:hypothetical protein [Botrimarina colliarenosi]